MTFEDGISTAMIYSKWYFQETLLMVYTYVVTTVIS